MTAVAAVAAQSVVVGKMDTVPAVVESGTIVGMVVETLSPRVNAGADSLEANLNWLLKRTKFPTPALMAAFVYLDRFLAKFPKTRFREPMRPLVTCLVLGMKFTEDAVYSNDTWASLLGIPLATINECELEFLSYLDFALFISDEDYANLRARADVFLGITASPALASIVSPPLPSSASASAMDVASGAPISAPSSPSVPSSPSLPPSPPPPSDDVVKPESVSDDVKPMDTSPSLSAPIVPTARAATRRGGIFRRLVGAVKGSWRAD